MIMIIVLYLEYYFDERIKRILLLNLEIGSNMIN